jgi:hypothetical protein
MVAAENEGQCFRVNVLYDWGATVSMISEEAVEVMGLAIAKQAKRIIKGLGDATTVSKGTCTLSLVARNGDRKTVTAWEVGAGASGAKESCQGQGRGRGDPRFDITH